ncbi:hypothetical protein FRB96_001279 [Tulasnella sp. 330]|nr:hypothetical protein FRB96_001279 [Tulasnella sp. 330]KAG8870771.1 hypothetical protein FRB97_009370 [Tulasnella sp. 331]KAG8872532.1 hypothetical protein FRB98_009538 [Tulasnella sp. 332]
MPAPLKWRLGESVRPPCSLLYGPRSTFNTEVDLSALTPRQASRQQFKQQQYQYECALLANHGKSHTGSRGSKNGNSVRMEARMAEGQLKKGQLPDTQYKPCKAQAQPGEVDMQQSMTIDYGTGEPQEMVDTRQEVNIAQLVRPRKMKGKRFTPELVRRADTVGDLPLSDFEKAMIESLRPEFLPEDGQVESKVEEDEWEIANASVSSFDLMSIASRDREIEA